MPGTSENTSLFACSERLCSRHDNDRKIPRTPSEIYTLNRSVAEKMKKIFLHRGIPVIPSLGAFIQATHRLLGNIPSAFR